ncbi:hypothetical protein BU23DRAFT_569235 [Bimuria novae-zelandiae CBS 107.79]|uniref:Uncharacterized protein n=1 Tax=Bimuria novae-zelandiae CBS 107.79 TaxID=1447943 RepID=A0A6A5V478_9PLEO|nr:hypothetical protein BU23DRAFT_569235 [Bimuria novae-zelandiae CBS 107.79]
MNEVRKRYARLGIDRSSRNEVPRIYRLSSTRARAHSKYALGFRYRPTPTEPQPPPFLDGIPAEIKDLIFSNWDLEDEEDRLDLFRLAVLDRHFRNAILPYCLRSVTINLDKENFKRSLMNKGSNDGYQYMNKRLREPHSTYGTYAYDLVKLTSDLPFPASVEIVMSEDDQTLLRYLINNFKVSLQESEQSKGLTLSFSESTENKICTCTIKEDKWNIWRDEDHVDPEHCEGCRYGTTSECYMRSETFDELADMINTTPEVNAVTLSREHSNVPIASKVAGFDGQITIHTGEDIFTFEFIHDTPVEWVSRLVCPKWKD